MKSQVGLLEKRSFGYTRSLHPAADGSCGRFPSKQQSDSSWPSTKLVT
jgi:hypothetical protein